MRKLTICLVVLLSALTLAAQQKNDDAYTAKIREYTTESFLSTELVDHLPAFLTRLGRSLATAGDDSAGPRREAEEHGVGMAAGHERQGLVRGLGELHGVAAGPEFRLHSSQDRRLVVNDEEIKLAECPEAVKKGLREHAKDCTIGNVTRSTGIGSHTFEAEVKIKDSVYLIEVAENGHLISKSLEAAED